MLQILKNVMTDTSDEKMLTKLGIVVVKEPKPKKNYALEPTLPYVSEEKKVINVKLSKNVDIKW